MRLIGNTDQKITPGELLVAWGDRESVSACIAYQSEEECIM